MAGPGRNPQLNKVLKQFIAEGYEFFVNSLLQPVVRIPDDPYQQCWAVTNDRFLAHISTVFYEATQDYLRTSERDMLIELLKEESYKGGRRLTPVEAEMIDKDSVIQAVLVFLSMHKKDFDGLTRDLLAELRKDPIQDRIMPPDPDFPVLTNIFSRRLGRLVSALSGFGVECKITHDEDGSHCQLSRSPNFKLESDALPANPSGLSSDVDSCKAKGTVPPDATDGSDALSEKDHPFLTKNDHKFAV